MTQEEVSVKDSGGDSGPVRMARVAYLQGSVSWRTDADADWSSAVVNLPLRQGAELWVNSGSRAELQFDDGSRVWIGNGTIATLETLYSDKDGEFTELKVNSGLVSMTLTNKQSMYQLDTPTVSVKSYGPSKIRVGVATDVEVAVRRGQCQIEGIGGVALLHNGEYCDVASSSSSFHVVETPALDGWDRFCDDRDEGYSRGTKYVPSNVGITCGNLDAYGDWRPDPSYGHVWYPRNVYGGWRPYHDGHWVWVDPFGWTWVGDEPWGWAPYHYGTWIHAKYGWGWCPGPAVQFWSPAVVSFGSYSGAVAWVPLAPSEVVYPAGISFGFAGGNWALSFSIGAAAAFYPGGLGFVVGRPWFNGYVNRSFGRFNQGRVDSMYVGPRFAATTRFLPLYGGSAFAITRTTVAGFAGAGRFQSGTVSDRAIFRHGASFAGSRGGAPVFGPAGVRPTRTAVTPSRAFNTAGPPAGLASRPVFRASVSAAVARHSAPIGPTLSPSSHPATVVHGGGSSSRATGGGVSKYSRYNSGATSSSGSKYARPHGGSGGVSRYSRPVAGAGTSGRTDSSRRTGADRSPYARSNRAKSSPPRNSGDHNNRGKGHGG